MRKLYGTCRAEELCTRTQQQIKELSSSEMEERDVQSDQEKQCKALLSKLDETIEYLKHTKSVFDDLGRASRMYEKGSQLVPRAEILDRLIRYEAHLSREFDRTKNYLERSIQMRLGHPQPPTLNIEIGQ
jgi:DNA primase large subunit